MEFHSCEKCSTGPRGLKCENKYRISVCKHFKLKVECRIVEEVGIPCGMPPAFNIVDDKCVVVCDGYCGDKHRKLVESGEWRAKKLAFLNKDLDYYIKKEEMVRAKIAELKSQYTEVIDSAIEDLRPDSPPKKFSDGCPDYPNCEVCV